jgi:E3 ubiquitin-protein ligase NEDD4
MPRTTDKLFLVIAVDGLAKPDIFSLPDPFAIVVVDSNQRYATSVIKNTLDPYWDERFDMSVILFSDPTCPWF